jgi:hypothetical protein
MYPDCKYAGVHYLISYLEDKQDRPTFFSEGKKEVESLDP